MTEPETVWLLDSGMIEDGCSTILYGEKLVWILDGVNVTVLWIRLVR